MNYYNEFAMYYDELMEDVDYENWYMYIEEIYKKHDYKPKKILDMACGTGNLTYHLCKRGYDVTCFDKSSDMLSIAYNKLLPFKNVNILNQDMVNFKLNKQFDSIISICDSMNYITDGENLLLVFKNVYEHLKENGLFIFDINSYYKLSSIIGNNVFAEDREDIYYVWQNYFDEKKNLSYFYLTFFIQDDEGRYFRFDEEHIERAYYIEEITNLLNTAGFKDIKHYDAFTFNSPNGKSERINFVVKK